MRALEARHHELAPLFAVKRQFVQRKAMNANKADDAATFDGAGAARGARSRARRRRSRSSRSRNAVTRWQADEAAHAAALDARDALRGVGGAHAGGPRRASRRRAVPRAAQARLHEARAAGSRDARTAFRVEARRRDHALRRRDGFALTDPGTDLVGALDQANYCIWCHEQGKDSCSRGLPEKKPRTGRRCRSRSRRSA